MSGKARMHVNAGGIYTLVSISKALRPMPENAFLPMPAMFL